MTPVLIVHNGIMDIAFPVADTCPVMIRPSEHESSSKSQLNFMSPSSCYLLALLALITCPVTCKAIDPPLGPENIMIYPLTAFDAPSDNITSMVGTIGFPRNYKDLTRRHSAISFVLTSGADLFDSSSKFVITNTADRVRSVFAIDVDGDGDMDVLSVSFEDDTIAWFENLSLNCPSGTYRGTLNGVTSCVNCPEGKYEDVAGT